MNGNNVEENDNVFNHNGNINEWLNNDNSEDDVEENDNISNHTGNRHEWLNDDNSEEVDDSNYVTESGRHQSYGEVR